MEKRALLAAVLSIGVLLIWNIFVSPPPPRKPHPAPAAKETKPETPKAAEPAPAGPPAEETVPEPPAEEAAAEAREIVVESDLYRIVFSTLGATIRAFDLKGYSNDRGEPIRLYRPASYVLPPLSVLLRDARTELPVSALYSADRDAVRVTTEPERLVFVTGNAGGVTIRKEFTFRPGSYAVDLSVTVRGAAGYEVALGNGFGIPENEPRSRYTRTGPVVLAGTKRKVLDKGDVKEGDLSFGPDVRWIAQEHTYFGAALKPAKGTGSARLFARHEKLEIALAGAGGRSDFVLYAGPKQYDILKKSGLQDLVDFGFWSFIAHPLFWLLKLLYRATGNYGVAIVLISVLTRVPFIPLMNKQQSSMKKMQQITPKVQELKKKFKNDPQRLNQETMKLYKEAGVNPMSGCMPMLLQIPVFFALYKVLLVAIELRQAPFFGWLTDLSAPDTLFGHFPKAIPLLGGSALGILPILMGATMFLQQRLTPNPTADPNQQKIMKYLPVIFTFMFFNLSSGLVLYWTVGNIIGIAQQLVVNRKAREAAKAA